MPGVKFRIFEWSGKNSFGARDKASRELAASMVSLAKRHPRAQLFVVGHSHGGNVALKSLPWMGQEEQRVRGVVCLSTPFLTLRDRSLGREGKGIIGFVPIIPFFAIVLWWWLTRDNSSGLTWWTWLSGMVGFLALVFVGLRVSEALEDKAKNVTRLAKLAPVHEDRLLIVRHTGDEASGALAAAMFASWLVSHVHARVNAPWQRFDERLKGWLPAPVWVVGFVVLGTLAIVLKWWHGPKAIVIGLATLAYGFYVVRGLIQDGNIRQLAIGASLFLLTPLLALVALGFGSELLSIAIFKEVTVESTPPGRWRVRLLEYRGDEASSELVHGAAYSDAAATELIVDWIGRRCTPVAGRRQRRQRE